LIIAVIYGLSTDYEVFLVSRMVEARERGMSTAEAIRIGTATTGRIITAAALVLIVVAGAFAFSDLVMMKYLAFGLITALLLDATVIRMFLVPAVMKMLGDDCWWAPRWMKRLQVKIGLGETHLPDERKRPMTQERDDEAALVGAGAPVPPRTPHDPTHPDGPPRPRAMPTRVPPAQAPPSGVGTTRIPTTHPASGDSDEAPTTRFSSAKNAVRSAVNNAAGAATAATHRQQAPAAPEREIESWLGELRGRPGSAAPQPHSQPSTDPTRSMPPAPGAESTADATTAIPTQRPSGGRTEDTSSATEAATRAIPIANPRATDTEAATEKLNSRAEGDKNGEGEDKPTRRGGGGVSAQDLLRREGRL
jgi:RND superfamily putative drug exporter